MTKAKRKNSDKRPKRGQGCMTLLLLVSACGLFAYAGQQNASTNERQAVRQAATSVPTVGEAARPEASPVRLTTNTPEPAPTLPSTATRQASATQRVVQSTATEASSIQVMNPSDYTTTGAANLRSCAGTDCNAVGQLPAGAVVRVTGSMAGESVNPGNSTWYRVEYNGQEVYIYSGVVSAGVQSAPVQQQQQSAPQQQQPAGNAGVPGNCSTAVAMGLTDVQAAQWSHLDRDGDGVACYGD